MLGGGLPTLSQLGTSTSHQLADGSRGGEGGEAGYVSCQEASLSRKVNRKSFRTLTRAEPARLSEEQKLLRGL